MESVSNANIMAVVINLERGQGSVSGHLKSKISTTKPRSYRQEQQQHRMFHTAPENCVEVVKQARS